jgi:2,3-bisphosphoglycerate-dependent phosphoglycerate mutase
MLSAVSSGWPATIWLVRHGESSGNIAREAAEASGAETIDIVGRDIDVPLSALGERQSRAVGAWFGKMPQSERPTVILTSPYERARQTSELIAQHAALEQAIVPVADERLREKEFGSLNRMTKVGLLARFPAEARSRAEVGKFYYRPPGGESWCDVILRLRSVLHHIQLRHSGERVLIVAHQVVVLCFRYLLEDLDEARLLEIDRAGDIANCSITHFELATCDGRRLMTLRNYNLVAALEEGRAPVTDQPDPAVGK